MNKFVLVFILIGFFQCANTAYSIKNPNSKIRLTAFSHSEGYVLKKRFEINNTKHHLFWGAVILKSDDLETILKTGNILVNLDQEAVGNLLIRESYTFLNSLYGIITIGIYRPYNVYLEGNLYEKKDEPSGIESKKEPEEQSLPESKKGILKNEKK
jgi:hypothetical protein